MANSSTVTLRIWRGDSAGGGFEDHEVEGEETGQPPAELLLERHGGEVPLRMADLVERMSPHGRRRYSAPGHDTPAGAEVERRLGQQPATIFLEPDGLATLECVPRRFRPRRYRLLRYAIRWLKHDRNATIYLDGGGSAQFYVKAGKFEDWLPGTTEVPVAIAFFLNNN